MGSNLIMSLKMISTSFPLSLKAIKIMPSEDTKMISPELTYFNINLTELITSHTHNQKQLENILVKCDRVGVQRF